MRVFICVCIKQWHFFRQLSREITHVNYPAQGLALSKCWIKILWWVKDGSPRVCQLTSAHVKPIEWVVPNDPGWKCIRCWEQGLWYLLSLPHCLHWCVEHVSVKL